MSLCRTSRRVCCSCWQHVEWVAMACHRCLCMYVLYNTQTWVFMPVAAGPRLSAHEAVLASAQCCLAALHVLTPVACTL
jgi:hypothetical protein